MDCIRAATQLKDFCEVLRMGSDSEGLDILAETYPEIWSSFVANLEEKDILCDHDDLRFRTILADLIGSFLESAMKRYVIFGFNDYEGEDLSYVATGDLSYSIQGMSDTLNGSEKLAGGHDLVQALDTQAGAILQWECGTWVKIQSLVEE